GVQQKSEEEEVDTEPRRPAVGVCGGDLRTAQQRSGKREGDSGERERLVRAKPGAGGAKQERHQQQQVNDRLQVCERSKRSQLVKSEELRESNGEHEAQTRDAEDRGDDPADEAVTERRRLGRFERETRKLASRGLLVRHCETPSVPPERRISFRSGGRRGAGGGPGGV